jgi:hypothetical protein
MVAFGPKIDNTSLYAKVDTYYHSHGAGGRFGMPNIANRPQEAEMTGPLVSCFVTLPQRSVEACTIALAYLYSNHTFYTCPTLHNRCRCY